MINQPIRSFFLFYVALFFIFSKVYSNENVLQNEIMEFKGIETTSPLSKSSNTIVDKKNVEENFLGEINLNGIGLISIETTKFPSDLWSNSSEKELSEKLNNMPNLSLATTNKIYNIINICFFKITIL